MTGNGKVPFCANFFPDEYGPAAQHIGILLREKKSMQTRSITTTARIFLSLFLVLGWANLSASEYNGALRGTVTTSDGKAAAAVSIQIRELDRSLMTDETGSFLLQNIPPGTYEITASLIGYEPVSSSVTIENGKVTVVALRLEVSSKQLKEVVITGGTNKFYRSSSDDVAKVPLKNIENPQVYSTITKELLSDQMVFSVDDAVKNAPGLQQMWEATNRGGDGGSYYNARGFILQSKLRNGVAGNVTSTIDAANLERIEVIKGPSATLFGSGLTSYGGLINRVTKKPFPYFGGQVGYATGSFGFNRISADLNAPLDKEKEVLMRVNAAYQREGSYLDNGFERSYALMPSLTYRLNDRLTFSFDAELLGGRNTSKPFIFFYFPTDQLNASNPGELGIDYGRSYSDPSITQEYRTTNFFAEMTYQLSDKWVSQTNFNSSNSFSDGPYAYFYAIPNAIVTGKPNAVGADYLVRAVQSTANSTDDVMEIQQNFKGDFMLGSFRNRFVGGLDVYMDNSNELFYGADFDTIPKNGNIPTYNRFNKDNLDRVLQDTNKVWTWPAFYKTTTYSAYASDVLNITDRLLVLAALRLDHFSKKGDLDKATGQYSGGYNQTALSPKFGIVFQPLKDKVSLFANYQNGFTNQTGSDVDGHPFKPEQANQIEGGVKMSLLGGRLSGTVSYYDIRVKDLVRPDQTHPNFSLQDGTQLSKGVEAEVVANPLNGLNLLAGFAYNESTLEKADKDVEGRRPATAMSPLTANLWISYKLPQGKARGLGFGFGGNYASENKIVNSVYYGVFTLPAYTVLNATVFYDRPQFRIGLKADNLTDRKYWIGYTTMNPQKPRQFTASISFKF